MVRMATRDDALRWALPSSGAASWMDAACFPPFHYRSTGGSERWSGHDTHDSTVLPSTVTLLYRDRRPVRMPMRQLVGV